MEAIREDALNHAVQEFCTKKKKCLSGPEHRRGKERTSTGTHVYSNLLGSKGRVRLLTRVIFGDVKTCLRGRVWQRVETLTATGCFCLNKNHTLCRRASGNYSSGDSEKPL